MPFLGRIRGFRSKVRCPPLYYIRSSQLRYLVALYSYSIVMSSYRYEVTLPLALGRGTRLKGVRLAPIQHNKDVLAQDLYYIYN